MTHSTRNTACQFAEWLKYTILATHRKGHGIHSPFVFEMISNVFCDKKKYTNYQIAEKLVKELRLNKDMVPFTELGSGSRILGKNSRRISDIAQHASVHRKYGRLLFRLVQHYRPTSIIEIGTSLGISSLYMALGNENTTIHTIEGNKSVSNLAQQLAEKAKITNIEFHQGLFDEVLPTLLNNPVTPDFAFIDGNHTYEATIRYFDLIKKYMKEGIILIDDIYWSPGMRKAWKEIQKNNAVTIDIFEMGIIIIRDKMTEGKYRIAF